MFEIREWMDVTCPRCGGRLVFKVIEIEDDESFLKQRISTCYIACFSFDEKGEVCWYHIKDYEPKGRREPEVSHCTVPGCTRTDFVAGRFICEHHYRLRCLERYYKHIKNPTDKQRMKLEKLKAQAC